MASAVIVTDMISDYDHPDADALASAAGPVVPVLAEAIRVAREAEVLVVYVNDNHNEWTLDRRGLIDWARRGRAPELIDPLVPPDDVPFVVKARHSIFYGTQTEYLLRQQGVDRLILTGQVTEQCILYSALDAYIRHFEVAVATDAVAGIHADLSDAALTMMERNMRARLGTAAELLDGSPLRD